MLIQNNEKNLLNNNLPKFEIKIMQKIIYYKNRFKILFNIKFYTYAFFFLSYLLYYISLEKCTKGMDLCPFYIDWIKRKIKEIIFSCLIMVILIELIIYKIISRLHLIHIIFFFLLFYSYSHGLDFEDHGYFNFIGFFILFFIFFILFFPINILLYLIRKYKRKSKLSDDLSLYNKNSMNFLLSYNNILNYYISS